MTLSPIELTRYSRHLLLKECGLEGQTKLKAARVLVVGAGGLGSSALLYLAAAGIGTLGIVDHDQVDHSNLQRQVLYDIRQLAQLKVHAARARLLALNPYIEVATYAYKLTAANAFGLLQSYNMVLDCTDNFTARYLLNDACVLLQKPYVTAAVHQFEGQVLTYLPAQGPCYRCLFPEPIQDGAVQNCTAAGVLGVLPGLLGVIQATEVIKWIIGSGAPLVGRWLHIDVLPMRFTELKCIRRDTCALCGVQPTLTTLQTVSPADSASTDVTSITATELYALLADTAPARGCLIDVREPEEFAGEHLSEAINIPLGVLPQRLASLPKDTPLIFMCRSGARSLTAARLAIAQAQTNVRQLEGGLLAWQHMHAEVSI